MAHAPEFDPGVPAMAAQDSADHPEPVIDILAAGTQNVHMKTATVRDLRNNFAMVEAWLRDGIDVCIEKRGEPVAMLTAIKRRPNPGKVKNPDFAARRSAIWGERVFSEQEVKEMRAYELEGEEG